MRQKIGYLLPLLFISQISRAAYGLEQLGEALVTFSILLAALPFIVGGIALLFVKEKKGRAFLIGFGITAIILLIWIFAGSSTE